MRALSLLLAATLLPAAEGETPAATLDGTAFTVRPEMISINRYRHWQQDGRTSDNQGFQLSLGVQCPRQAVVVGWRELVIDQAVTDTGEKLTLPRSGGSNRQSRIDANSRRQNDGEGQRFSLPLAFEFPSQPSDGLATLSGRVTVLVASGTPKKAVLKPFKDVAGKLLEIDGVPGAEVSLEKNDSNQRVTVRYPTALQDQLFDVTFLDAGGRELRFNSSGTNGSNGEIESYFQVRMPEDGAVVLSFLPETRPLVVPFTLKDVLLGGPAAKAKRERVKIEAKEAKPEEPRPIEGETLKVRAPADKPGF